MKQATLLFLASLTLGACELATAPPQEAVQKAMRTEVKTSEAVVVFNETCGSTLPTFAGIQKATPRNWVSDGKGSWRSDDMLLSLSVSEHPAGKFKCALIFGTTETQKTTFAVIHQSFGISAKSHHGGSGKYQSTDATVSATGIASSGAASGPNLFSIQMQSASN